MKVSEIMTERPLFVSPDTTLDDAIRMMEENRVRHLPVLEEECLTGVVSDRDLLEATGWLPARVLEVFKNRTGELRIADVMKRPAVAIGPDVSVISACLDMLGRSIGCLPVVEDSRLIGMISEMDVLSVFIRQCGGGPYDSTVESCMTHEVTCVEDETTLQHAAELMLSLGIRHLPIVQDRQILGMLSDRDLQRGIGSGRSAESPVGDLMSRQVFNINSQERLSRAAELMNKHRIGALPVVADKQLEGMISMSDVLDVCLDGLREPEQSKSS